MEHPRKRALIVAQPGPLRDSLRFLLLSIPGIEEVKVASDAASAWQEIDPRCAPDLLLLDANLPNGDGATLVCRFKAAWPCGRVLVLTDTRSMMVQMEDAGANVVLLKGFPAAELFAVVCKLVQGDSTLTAEE